MPIDGHPNKLPIPSLGKNALNLSGSTRPLAAGGGGGGAADARVAVGGVTLCAGTGCGGIIVGATELTGPTLGSSSGKTIDSCSGSTNSCAPNGITLDPAGTLVPMPTVFRPLIILLIMLVFSEAERGLRKAIAKSCGSNNILSKASYS